VTGMQIATVTPQRAVTSGGQARAVLQPSTIGAARVVAGVEGMQQEVRFSVSTPPSPSGMSSP
jgi:hypothetical protein